MLVFEDDGHTKCSAANGKVFCFQERTSGRDALQTKDLPVGGTPTLAVRCEISGSAECYISSMELILVSMCLIGAKVRYNATDSLVHDARLAKWADEGRLIAVCPEVMSGLSTPRPATEIIQGFDGEAVIKNQAQIIDENHVDFTEAYLRGANVALELVKNHKIKMAVLKDGSPSCGRTYIYDGSFSGKTKTGMGSTAALLESQGVKVFSELQLDAAENYLISIDKDYLKHL